MEVVHAVKGARRKDAKGRAQPDKNKEVMNIDCHFCGRQHQRNKEHCLTFGQVVNSANKRIILLSSAN